MKYVRQTYFQWPTLVFSFGVAVVFSMTIVSCKGGSAVEGADTPLRDSSTATESTDTAETSTDISSEDIPSDFSSESETGSEAGCITDDTGTGLDTGTGFDTDTGIDTGTSVDTSTQLDTSTGVNSGTGLDTSTGADTSSDSGMGTDSDDSDTTPPGCPADMVRVSGVVTEGDFCIDKYEASRPDATVSSVGVDETQAMSVANVLPWNVNPMNTTVLASFKTACQNAGKFLCTDEQWVASCEGPAQTAYVYGDIFDVEACNNVAAFCDDYCEENQIDPHRCNTNASSCGYDCGEGGSTNICFKVTPTGRFGGCTNEFGAFDINGNVWEIVATDATTGYEIRGGAYNCASPQERFRCSYTATWTALYAGFRCCRDL